MGAVKTGLRGIALKHINRTHKRTASAVTALAAVIMACIFIYMLGLFYSNPII
jgi:hypothetical protein